MKGYLRREKTEERTSQSAVQDVTVDIPDGTDVSPGLEIQVTIAEGNDARDRVAFVVPRYPVFEPFDLGAEVVIPIIETSGSFLRVGTILTIRPINV
jgi:hypothetical protein